MGIFTYAIIGGFLAYMSYTAFVLVQFFHIPSCVEKDAQKGHSQHCIPSWLSKTDTRLQLVLYGSDRKLTRFEPRYLLYNNNSFHPDETFHIEVNVTLSEASLNNGNFTLHMVLIAADKDVNKDIKKSEVLSDASASLTEYTLPKLKAFNLMGDNSSKASNRLSETPTLHWRSCVTLSVMTDDISFTRSSVPAEIHPLLRLDRRTGSYMPIAFIDHISFRLRDLVPVERDQPIMSLKVVYQPIGAGKLRFWQSIQTSFVMLRQLGFGEKEVDEVKGIFADTNFYVLMLTFLVSAVHILFDFLAFKNDISYWKNRESMVGLSSRAVVWRCVSTVIIFFYLMDQQTSLLVLIPCGISAVIEIWKLKKAFKVTLTLSGVKYGKSTESEKETQEFDAVAMSYLSYILYPLILGGAVYSLLYTPHKSWYSWCLQSLVNGVYAFGFLFMLPQLFVNYKLKSVAHLPWKAFMYKAFNTFIDDLFAFIIMMPTSHRLACFRDDIVFLIYLFQRWLYPVDKSRVNEYGQSFEGGKDKAKPKSE